MRKYNINNKPFDFPENLNEFQENSTKNNIKISYKENRYKASEKILNEDELIETLKNNDCLFGNSAFIHLCKEKYQIIEEVYNIKLDHLQKSFIIKNDIKSIRTTLHKPFYKDVLNYYKGDEKEILYSYHHFIILEEICRLEEEGKTKEEIKKIIFNTEELSKKEKEYFDIGVEKYNAKDFRNAVNYFNNYLEVNKENIEAYKYIAESYYKFSVIASYESQVNTDMILLEENSDYFLIPVGVDDGVSIDATTAEQLGIKSGQELRIVMNGQVYNKKVTYVFESAFLRGIYDLQKNYPEELSAPSSYYINLNDGVDSAVFEEELMANFNILSMMSKEDVLKEADNILSTISTMTDIVKIFAILLSIVVIYNLTSLNIAERSRDIATMKVLGFRYKEISKTLTYEIMLDVLIGSLIGVFVGYPLMVLVLVVNQTNLLTFIDPIQWYTYLLAFVIAFAVSLLVSLVLNLKSKKINMTASLKSIE